VGSEHEVDVVPGLRHDTVQSFDMIVSQGMGADLHTVVVANSPVLSQHDRSVIAQALAATRRPALAFLVQRSPGSATAECSACVDPRATASAVAALCASAGWDESVPLEISVNGSSMQVAVGSDGKRWLCRLD
jgi:hypothetical protein